MICPKLRPFPLGRFSQAPAESDVQEFLEQFCVDVAGWHRKYSAALSKLISRILPPQASPYLNLKRYSVSI